MAGIGTNIFAGANLNTGSQSNSPALASATYGPSTSTGRHPLSPTGGFGVGFWMAVGGLVLLIAVRSSLPR
jgi:hypothetical protein